MSWEDSLSVLGFGALICYGMWQVTNTSLGKVFTLTGAISIIICAIILRKDCTS